MYKTNSFPHSVQKKRHIAKTISYRILSSLVGFIIVSVVTNSIAFGTTFSVIELLYKPLQYYIHERIWYKWIKYGLTDYPEKNRSFNLKK